MVSVICPCVECKHNGRMYRCKCKEIRLVWRNMVTVNEGRVNMWVCTKYEDLRAENKDLRWELNEAYDN